jgi:hypothetical protein
VVHRHLVGERSDAMIDKLEIFLKEAVGRQYGIAPSKLFKRKSIKMSNCDIASNDYPQEEEVKASFERLFVEEDRTFFCSELIAKAFKVLGIIEDDDKACSQFFPGSFSSKSSSLKFANGMYLEPELNIVVEVPPEYK